MLFGLLLQREIIISTGNKYCLHETTGKCSRQQITEFLFVHGKSL